MPTVRADLITHPIRARILTALLGRPLTTQQIAHLLPDVPMPSIYRHVRLLAENGILTAVEEVRVNGALSKVYAVDKGQTRIDKEDIPDATSADHMRYFTTFLNTLAESFRGYLEHEPEPAWVERIHCLMEPLHLDPAEHAAFLEALQVFMKPWREKAPSAERQRLIFAHLLLPDRKDPPLS